MLNLVWLFVILEVMYNIYRNDFVHDTKTLVIWPYFLEMLPLKL